MTTMATIRMHNYLGYEEATAAINAVVEKSRGRITPITTRAAGDDIILSGRINDVVRVVAAEWDFTAQEVLDIIADQSEVTHPPQAVNFFPTADGGGVLRFDGVRVVLDIHQTNELLAGLLRIATIKIEADES